MKEYNIHFGHILMAVAIMLGISFVAVIFEHATIADAARIVLSSIGTIVLLLTLKDFK